LYTVLVAANGSNINPVALAIMNLTGPNGAYIIPSPQIAGSGANYTASVPSIFNDHLSLKAMVGADPTYKSFGDVNVPGFGSTQDFWEQLYTVADTHIFSPTLVNDARFGVNRTIGTVIPQDNIPLSAIGMQRFNSSEYNDIPLITVTGAFEIGYDTNGDQSVHPTEYSFRNTISWVKGKHQIRAGVEVRRYDDNYSIAATAIAD
jgi:hypothetical protein